MKRVDWAINNSISRNIPIMLNIHHYRELFDDPAGHKERFLALWKQIAEHYKDYPDLLVFEILNEPQKKLRADGWNKLAAEALAVIRESNPDRTVVIGSAHLNQFEHLKLLEIPENDRNIIVTVHYYFPMRFTHQGTSWISHADASGWVGTKWTGSEQEKEEIIKDFDYVADWAKKHNRPINLGEFGAYRQADMDSRARWTKFVADAAIDRGFSFDYWEFCAAEFGAYDQKTKSWRKPLLEALVEKKQ